MLIIFYVVLFTMQPSQEVHMDSWRNLDLLSKAASNVLQGVSFNCKNTDQLTYYYLTLAKVVLVF